MRLGINVPNELIKQVKAIDPEVNISHLCREALKSYTAATRRVTERVAGDGISEQILRLEQSKHRPVVEPDWVGYALEDARDWVRAIDPDEWYDFWDYYDECKERGRDLSGIVSYPFPEKVKFLHIRMTENQEWRHQQFRGGVNRDALQKAEEEYNRTWLAYVTEVQQKQLQHFEDEHRRVMAEREKALKARPEPELPPQLRY